MLDEMVWPNTSKFAIFFYRKENFSIVSLELFVKHKPLYGKSDYNIPNILDFSTFQSSIL